MPSNRIQSTECATTNKQNVTGIEGNPIASIISKLNGSIDHGALKQFQQTPLHSISWHVFGGSFSSKRGKATGSASDFIYFIDTCYPRLGYRYVSIGFVQQSGQDGFNLIANVARLGKLCDIDNYRRQFEDFLK